MYQVQNANMQTLGDFEWRLLRAILSVGQLQRRSCIWEICAINGMAIFFRVQKNGVSMISLYDDLVVLHSEPDILGGTKTIRIRWAGHVARIPKRNSVNL